jgi:hypothetical protein
MKRTGAPVALGVLLLLGAAPLDAQERGDVGVALGYPGSLALVWHPTDAVALRPDFTFSRSSVDLMSSVPFPSPSGRETIKTFSWAFGLSGLLYAGKWDALRTYLVPRIAYGRASSDISTSSSNWSVSTSGSFGGQYSLGQRFAVFGETGVAYTHSRASGTVTSQSGNTWTIRTEVGAVLYFR